MGKRLPYMVIVPPDRASERCLSAVLAYRDGRLGVRAAGSRCGRTPLSLVSREKRVLLTVVVAPRSYIRAVVAARLRSLRGRIVSMHPIDMGRQRVVGVSMGEVFIEMLNKCAEKMGISKSELIRQAIYKMLAETPGCSYPAP